MIKLKLSSGSQYISTNEEQAIKQLQQLLSAEDGYVIPVMFLGKKVENREIDAMLLLPDAIFLLDFKNWQGERIEVPGINGSIRRLSNGRWEDEKNTLPNYEYAARELHTRLKREKWLPNHPRVVSALVFTNIGFAVAPQISFAGGDPRNPLFRDGVSACRIELLPQLIAAFRAEVSSSRVSLERVQLSLLADVLVKAVKSPAKALLRRVEGYIVSAEHHTDEFLNCKIYLGEGEPIKEAVWIKEYDPVFSSQERRSERETLVLRHADVLHRFPQHKNIVAYRTGKSTASHLYIILARKPGVFLSELLDNKPLGPTTQADLQRIPFDLPVRLHLLGDLLSALYYLTQQPGFERSAYRDLRPENIFVQYTDSLPIAQLFNFDCTKMPGSVTKRSHLKAGQERFPLWDDYASPELLAYIDAGGYMPSGAPASFTGDVSSDIFSWAVIAWRMFTGELPFPDTAAKLAGRRNPWPDRLAPPLHAAGSTLSPEIVQLLTDCLEYVPVRRPNLGKLRSLFP